MREYYILLIYGFDLKKKNRILLPTDSVIVVHLVERLSYMC